MPYNKRISDSKQCPFRSQFGVNHLGHFLLAKLLLPVLRAAADRGEAARVVNLTAASGRPPTPPSPPSTAVKSCALDTAT